MAKAKVYGLGMAKAKVYGLGMAMARVRYSLGYG